MTVSNWVFALVAVSVFAGIVVRLFRGEGLWPRKKVREGRDYDRVALEGGYTAELALGVLATARLAADPAIRPVGFLLLAMAAVLPVFGERIEDWSSSLILGALGGLAAVAAYGDLVGGNSSTSTTTVIVVTAVAMALTLGSFGLRLVLGGWLLRDLSLGAFLLGVFAIVELAPIVVAPSRIPLLADETAWWLRVLLVGLLFLVAVGVGLRPRFSAGVVAIALAIVSVSLALAAGPTSYGVHLGWVLTAAVVVVVFRIVHRLLPGPGWGTR